MSFSNLRIGARLAMGFSFLIVMLLIAGGVALTNLSDFNQKMDQTVSKLYPLTVKGNQLIDALNNALLGQQVTLVLDSPDQIKRKAEEIKGYSEKITQLINELKNSEQDERTARLVNEIQQVRGEYSVSGNKLMALILSGDQPAAKEELLNVSLGLQQKYRAKVLEFIDYEDDQMVNARETVKQSYSRIVILLIAVFVVSIVAGGLIAWAITRSVTTPLRQALRVAERVAKGDLTSDVVTNHKDETGLLLRALHEMNGSLRAIVTQVRDGADTISSAASQIAAGNQDLSARTEEQASSLEQTAASIEQLTSTIKNTAENTEHAASLASQASGIVRQSGEMMANVTREMREIKESSQRMAEIISVIDGIAFQTNILALNAAVEAARAGEQGRGFAVVASEVRALAQRSAASAKEIKELIDDSVQKVQDGMVLVENTEHTMGAVIDNAQSANGVMNEIAQASQEQSEGINQINLAIGQIDTTTQQNAALVEESAAAAISLQEQAQSLAQVVNIFKLGSSLAGRDVVQPVNKTPKLALANGMVATEKGRVANEEWTSF
ncbi:methyl-accepting chemotaxis protein [Musicola paradisiaca]|uniref:Methyl-accepting chemotaxis sensory transducer n=1 Tax=Musicola paradisiaca (strain Ech703) TaxID=579405 RepID=C6C3M3_MUSP7|nr:methyl-accepting chemotaxis protein [Musicola paradisiaca]ACS85368.1 methyl-accepting chemotaxis sensory transducer [Musicola paradisiaca Ech703]